MLSALRGTLNTWPVRMFFGLLVLAFGLWGVGDMIRVVGRDSWVAKVAGHRIGMPQFQQAYQREMAQLTRSLGGRTEPTAEMRQMVAYQAVERLVTQVAIGEQVARLGIQVTDEAVRQVTFSQPAFQGPGGHFDHAMFLSVLERNGLDEGRFLDMARADLADKQLLGAVRAGAAPPAVMARDLYQFRNEKRLADAVELAFAAAPAPPAPAEAQLQRYWQNHPEAFSTPEYRRVKAVILSAETLAKSMPVSDEDLRAAFEQRKSEFEVPEKRSVDLLVAQDEAKAKALAEQWRGGAEWSAIEAAAKAAGASAVQLDDAPEKQIPVPALAKEVFAAAPDSVTGPFQTDLGWYVAKVTKLTPAANRTFEEAKEDLRREVAEQKAADAIYDRANKVEDAMAGGGGIDELPPDLGLAGVTGTLDAKGDTPEGKPAPIPGPPELRSALVSAAFHAKPGDPPHLTEVPAPAEGGQQQVSSYYALIVENILPPAVKPFEQVKTEVQEAWTRDAVRHEQEQAAARIYAAVKGGEPLADAALKAGASVRRLPPVGRQGGVEGVPAPLVQPLFGMKKGQATMVETPGGFLVAVLTDIQEPDPGADPDGYAKLRVQLTESLGADLENVYVAAVRARDDPRINRQMVDSVAQP